jgi:hypothetical protein
VGADTALGAVLVSAALLLLFVLLVADVLKAELVVVVVVVAVVVIGDIVSNCNTIENAIRLKKSHRQERENNAFACPCTFESRPAKELFPNRNTALSKPFEPAFKESNIINYWSKPCQLANQNDCYFDVTFIRPILKTGRIISKTEYCL